MRKAVVAVVIAVLMLASSFAMLAPGSDADAAMGVKIFHDGGSEYTDGDTLVNGAVEVNSIDGMFIVPAGALIPTDPSHIRVYYPPDVTCYIGFAAKGAEQFLLDTKVKAELYSDQARTSLMGVAVANMTDDCVFFMLDDEKVSFQKETDYYIVLRTSEECMMADIPSDPFVTFVFDAESDIHRLSFDSNGGSPAEIDSRYLVEGGAYGELPEVTKEGCSLLGWYDGDVPATAETLMGDEDVELQARWLANVHQVTFDSDGGTPSTIPPRSVTEGDPIGNLPSVTKSGYSFLGWHDGTSYVTKDTPMGGADIHLTARWEAQPGPTPPAPKTFTLRYDANGGSGAPPAQTYSGTESSHAFTVSSTVPKWEGHTFLGWSTSSKGSASYQGGDSITVTGTTTLYAVWTDKPSHTVSYDVNGGSGSVPSQSVAEDSTFTVASYSGTKPGYKFMGWSYGGTIYSPGTMMAMGKSDMAFTAAWEELAEHTLYFNGNGGRADIGSKQVREGEPYGELPGAERQDFVFLGWFTSQSGGSMVSPDTLMGGSDAMVFAQWVFSGDEHEEHDEEVLPDGSVVETDIIDRTYPDDRTEHIEDTTITHPDSSAERTYGRTMRDPEGKVLTEEGRSVETDASGRVTDISFEIKDNIGDTTVSTRYYPGTGSLDSSVWSDVITEDIADAMISQIVLGSDFLSGYGISSDSTVTAQVSYGVTVESEALSLLAGEGYGLYVEAETGSMYLDDGVISSAASYEQDVLIKIERGTSHNLTPDQQKVIGGGFAVVVTMVRGTEQVHDIGGTASIKLEPGLEGDVFVYYIQEDGSYEEMESSYDRETGEVRFTVTHFSVYFAASEQIQPGGDGISQWWIVIAAAVLLIVILAVLYRLRRD